MLILTRRIGESIFIGDEIIVQVVSLNESAAGIGIRAPLNIDVHRDEIYRKIQLKKLQEITRRF